MLLIYDCDGTLIDTETAVADVALAAIADLGLTGWTLDRYIDAFVGMPSREGWALIAEEYAKPLPDGFNDRINAEIQRRFALEIKAFPGVVEAIIAAGEPRCVASSTSLEPLRRNLKQAGLLHLFGDAVYSASQVARGKPHPDVFLFAAESMGQAPADCLVIEDSVPGVLAARAAGMIAIGYVGSAHDQPRLTARLIEAGAAEVITHMDAWPEAVARWCTRHRSRIVSAKR